MWCGCWCPRAVLCRRRISVTNEGHVARQVLTACHYRQCFFLLAHSWKGLEMIIISFLKWLREALAFILSRFRERKGTLFIICAEFTIILLSQLNFLNISKFTKFPWSARVHKERGKRKEETVVKQVGVFLGFRWGVYFTAAVPDT